MPASSLSKEEEAQIKEWSSQLFPGLPPEKQATILRGLRCLMQPTAAGAERRAIMDILMRNDVVPGSELYRLCTRKVEARIREMRRAGIEVQSWIEPRPAGGSHTVYSMGTPQIVRAMRLVFGNKGDETALKRVM